MDGAGDEDDSIFVGDEEMLVDAVFAVDSLLFGVRGDFDPVLDELFRGRVLGLSPGVTERDREERVVVDFDLGVAGNSSEGCRCGKRVTSVRSCCCWCSFTCWGRAGLVVGVAGVEKNGSQPAAAAKNPDGSGFC